MDSRELYRHMLRLRLIEEEIAERYSEQEMRCPVHLSIGQEATAVGVAAVLRRDDQVVSTHRCHGHYLAKGGDLKAMLAEMYGRAAGCCGGRGGSMHLFDPDVGVLTTLPIVASSIPIGVGAALAIRQQGKDAVAVAFIGDASVEEGVFHESANFASLKKLPIVFVLENNLFSVYTDLKDRQPPRPLTSVAEAHGMAAVNVDGNDVEAVTAHAGDAIGRARAGEGPTLMVCDTYRWREHCGPDYDNDLGYRKPEEFEEWKARCPVETLRAKLISRNELTPEDDESLAVAIKREIADAFEFARNAPFPEPEDGEEFVYA